MYLRKVKKMLIGMIAIVHSVPSNTRTEYRARSLFTFKQILLKIRMDEFYR